MHQEDLAGSLLEKGGWYHLNLPAIAEEDAKIPIGPDEYYWRKCGDVLHPKRHCGISIRPRSSIGFWSKIP